MTALMLEWRPGPQPAARNGANRDGWPCAATGASVDSECRVSRTAVRVRENDPVMGIPQVPALVRQPADRWRCAPVFAGIGRDATSMSADHRPERRQQPPEAEGRHETDRQA